MVDLIELRGFGVLHNINREHTTIQLYTPDNGAQAPLVFRADTKYEAIRKAFNYWTKHNA